MALGVEGSAPVRLSIFSGKASLETEGKFIGQVMLPEFVEEWITLYSGALNRKRILSRIRRYLDGVKQWNAVPDSYEWIQRAGQYAARAEGLIELLEEFDCGAVGGHCDGHTGSNHLETRYQWLVEHTAK